MGKTHVTRTITRAIFERGNGMSEVDKMKKELGNIANSLQYFKNNSGFARWAFVVLLAKHSKVRKAVVEQVLDGLETLVDEAFETDGD